MKKSYIPLILLASLFITGCDISKLLNIPELPENQLPENQLPENQLSENEERTNLGPQASTIYISGTNDKDTLAAKYFDDDTKTPVVRWQEDDIPDDASNIYTIMRNKDSGEVIWYAKSNPDASDSSSASSDGFDAGKAFSPPKRPENTDDEYEVIIIAADNNFDPDKLTPDSDIANIPGVISHKTKSVTVPSIASAPLIVTDISSEENLKTMQHCLDCSYTIEKDITITDDWESIGPDYYHPFEGRLDGNGRTIENLNDFMFGYIGNNGEVKDLTIKKINPNYKGTAVVAYRSHGTISNVHIEASDTTITRTHLDNRLGGIVIHNGYEGIIKDSSSSINLDGGDDALATGGISASNIGRIENSFSTGNTKGGILTGGLVGINFREIIASHVSGNVKGKHSVGGLVGLNLDSIKDSYTTGNVEGDVEGDGSTGGLVGANEGPIDNSYATGKIVGGESTGGLIGANYYGYPRRTDTILGPLQGGSTTNSHATGDVTGTDYTGGLIGRNGAPIENSYASGNVIGSGNNVGGLVGENNYVLQNGVKAPPNKPNIKNSHATGTVASNGNNVGGLAGLNTGPVEDSYAIGDVTGANSVGGFIGENNEDEAAIYNSYSTGKVDGNMQVGGFIGKNNANIQNSYATGNIEGNNDVGGFIGENDADIKNIYASGTVNGQNNVGGLIGSNEADIDKSYAAGSVSGALNVGGLIGKLDSPIIGITRSYFDNTKANRDIGNDNIGSSIISFTNDNDRIEYDALAITKWDFRAWDFNNIWEWKARGQWPTLNKDAILED